MAAMGGPCYRSSQRPTPGLSVLRNLFGYCAVKHLVNPGVRRRRTAGAWPRGSGVAHAKEESVMRGLVYRTGWAHLAAGAVLAGLLSAPGLALGQSLKEQIVGAWRIVAIYNEAGGGQMALYRGKNVGVAEVGRFRVRISMPF